jgi:hypothetical protein
MAKRIVRLTESDLVRLVKKVVKEQMDDDKEPQFVDFGMEPIDNTRFDDEEYMTDWQNRFKDWVGSGKSDEHKKHHASWKDRQTKKSMDESEEGGKKLSDEEMRRVLSAVWDSMSAAEKKKIMTKVDKERKEKGLSSLRPKS